MYFWFYIISQFYKKEIMWSYYTIECYTIELVLINCWKYCVIKLCFFFNKITNDEILREIRHLGFFINYRQFILICRMSDFKFRSSIDIFLHKNFIMNSQHNFISGRFNNKSGRLIINLICTIIIYHKIENISENNTNFKKTFDFVTPYL